MHEIQQLVSDYPQSQKDHIIETTLTESGLRVKVTVDVNDQRNVYEGIIDRKVLADGSAIRKSFTNLQGVRDYIQGKENTRIDLG